MATTDVLSDCLTRIRNAIMADHNQVMIPHSNLKEAVLNVLKREGYLNSVEVVKDAKAPTKKRIVAGINYTAKGMARLQHIKRVSTPGQRVYTKAPTKRMVRSGLGMQIISSSKGIITDKEALEQKIGGEVLAEIW